MEKTREDSDWSIDDIDQSIRQRQQRWRRWLGFRGHRSASTSRVGAGQLGPEADGTWALCGPRWTGWPDKSRRRTRSCGSGAWWPPIRIRGETYCRCGTPTQSGFRLRRHAAAGRWIWSGCGAGEVSRCGASCATSSARVRPSGGCWWRRRATADRRRRCGSSRPPSWTWSCLATRSCRPVSTSGAGSPARRNRWTAPGPNRSGCGRDSRSAMRIYLRFGSPSATPRRVDATAALVPVLRRCSAVGRSPPERPPVIAIQIDSFTFVHLSQPLLARIYRMVQSTGWLWNVFTCSSSHQFNSNLFVRVYSCLRLM